MTRHISIFILRMMRGWITSLRFQRQNFVQDLSPGSLTATNCLTLHSVKQVTTEAELHCGKLPTSWIVTSSFHQDGVRKLRGRAEQETEARNCNWILGSPHTHKMLLTPAHTFSHCHLLGQKCHKDPRNLAYRKNVELTALYQIVFWIKLQAVWALSSFFSPEAPRAPS